MSPTNESMDYSNQYPHCSFHLCLCIVWLSFKSAFYVDAGNFRANLKKRKHKHNIKEMFLSGPWVNIPAFYTFNIWKPTRVIIIFNYLTPEIDDSSVDIK